MNFILSWLHSSAQKHTAPILQAEQVREAPPDVVEEWDLPYSGGNGNPLAADVYRPAAPAEGPLPTAVMVHGGGLFAGTRKINRAFCEKLAQRGFLVFALEYRLISDSDAFGIISDVCSGFDFVQDNLQRYGGDPTRVCVIGESAGGYLSLYATALTNSHSLQGMLGLRPPRLRPFAFVGVCGMFYTTRFDPLGLVYRKDLYGEHRKDPIFMDRINPGNPSVISHLPPVLLTSSRGDFLRGYTLRFAQSLEDMEYAHELVYFPEGTHLKHAFASLTPSLPESEEVMTKLIAWLKTLPPSPVRD
jgi:acetyl esterase/lipase